MGFGAKYADVLANVEHYIALGQTSVYLDSTDNDLPWDRVHSVEPGGLHRLDIRTSVNFKAQIDGLELRWIIDIEDDDANGLSHYKISVERLARTMEVLPPEARAQFEVYLRDCAEKIEARGDELQKLAQHQYGQAGVLRGIVRR